MLPVQTLGELFHVLVRKAKRRPEKAREAILSWRVAFEIAGTSSTVKVRALDLAAKHGLSIWDAVVLTTAAEVRCRVLVSEDMQDGFMQQGVPQQCERIHRADKAAA